MSIFLHKSRARVFWIFANRKIDGKAFLLTYWGPRRRKELWNWLDSTTARTDQWLLTVR